MADTKTDTQSNKMDLLRQINDAASQIGSKSGNMPVSYAGGRNKLAEINSMRGAEAKRAAQMVLSGGLNKTDLDILNKGTYNHNHTLLGAK